MVERRKASGFERLVKEHRLMTAMMIFPVLCPWELARFCRLKKASHSIFQKIVNFKALFEAWGLNLTPAQIKETLISASIALQVAAKCIMLKSLFYSSQITPKNVFT